MQLYISGFKPICELLSFTPSFIRFNQLILLDTQADDLLKRFASLGFEIAPSLIKRRRREDMNTLVADAPPVLAEVLYQPFNEQDLKAQFSPKAYPFLLMLDRITDPHNMGAIIRSAECFGVSAIIVSSLATAPINTTVSKTSAGALVRIPIFKVSNLARTLDWLKQQGVWSISTQTKTQGAENLHEFESPMPCLLIMGSEGEGVKPILQQKSDFQVHIPQMGVINSLNVSVATGVLLSEIRRQHPSLTN